MGQSETQMCPPLRSSEQVNAELERRFVVCPHPLYTRFLEFKLLHQRLTNRKFALRVIAADEQEKRNLEERVLRRKAMTKSTLTHLQHYIFERLEAYCSQQYRVHLLFALDAPVTLREEILKQGKGRANFTQDELISGLEDLVGGLLWVRFLKEKHGNISTHHIYCKEGKLQLADPFLCPQGLEFPEKYPSPQKLQQMANKIDDHNSYEADLFSIAMCILQAIPNVHLEAAYKRNFTINEKALREEMQKCNYPRLKNILQSLLLSPDNLKNRRRYLQLYTSKSNNLCRDLSSSRSQRPIKIHTLGNRMNGSRQSRNSVEDSETRERMGNRGLGEDPPEIDTQFLQTVGEFPSNKLQENYEHRPFLQLNNVPRVPNQQASKQIVFNYGNSQESGLSYLKRVQSIPTIDTNTHIPHHLYQFNNGPFIMPKQKVETFPSQVVSRSSSDYSVKSQLVVYEPSKSSFNLDLISPRQPNDEPLIKEKEFQQEDNIPIKINRCLDFSVNNSYTKPEQQQYPTHHYLNIAEAKPVLSYGIYQNQSSNCQESFVISSKQIENGKKEEATSNNIQSLPMKLSYLVKDKVIEQSNTEQYHEVIHTSPPSQLKSPEKIAYNPNFLNHTIPEEQPEEQESFDAGDRQQKGQYMIQLYQNGSKYEGFIYNNKREGYGTFYYKDGGYYQGEWKHNLMNGNGRLYYDNDHLAYEGQWYNDQFHGKGKVYNDSIEPLDGHIDYSNFQTSQAYWTQYIGELSHDIKQGFGKWIFSNGEYYQGEFKDDLPSGKGTFHSFNKKIKGVWNQGKLQSFL